MDPSNKPKDIPESHVIIDSKIISRKQAELISKWIDKLDSSEKLSTLYEFKLILGGSRDGFTGKKFHGICDNQPHTVSIIKVKDSNEILGRYNPIEWKSISDIENFDNFTVTKDSFIFSFKNKRNIDDCVLSRVKNKRRAIENFYYFGPSFGDNDLVMFHDSSNGCCCKINDYEKQIRATTDKFFVEEYEVFQVRPSK